MKRPRLIAAVIISLTGPANAQSSDVNSANAVMPGCEAVGTSQQGFGAGYCVGIINALMNIAPIFRACPPVGVSAGQSLRVVIAFINQNPARMHEPFEVLVIEAFRNAWPCRN